MQTVAGIFFLSYLKCSSIKQKEESPHQHQSVILIKHVSLPSPLPQPALILTALGRASNITLRPFIISPSQHGRRNQLITWLMAFRALSFSLFKAGQCCVACPLSNFEFAILMLWLKSETSSDGTSKSMFGARMPPLSVSLLLAFFCRTITSYWARK